MTVLAQHSSPTAAYSCPKRDTLAWQSGKSHILLCDTFSMPVAAQFYDTRAGEACLFATAQSALDLESARALISTPEVILAVGSEPYLQSLHAQAWAAGVAQTALCFQQHGSMSRDVLCMQCGQIARHVARRIQTCSCGATLLVRDHFSARRGLYQGAPIDPADELVGLLQNADFKAADGF